MGILHVEAQHDVPVTATQARINIAIPGNESVFGNAAVKKAAEVRSLTTELLAAGIGDEDIDVMGIRLFTETGKLTRNQRVEFQVRVTASAAQLGSVIGIVADLPNVHLRGIDWVFDEFGASLGAIPAAMSKARRKAEAIAAAAGQRITGIAKISDNVSMPFTDDGFYTESAGVLRSRSSKTTDLGVDFTSTRILTLFLSVDFTLENLAEPSHDG